MPAWQIYAWILIAFLFAGALMPVTWGRWLYRRWWLYRRKRLLAELFEPEPEDPDRVKDSLMQYVPVDHMFTQGLDMIVSDMPDFPVTHVVQARSGWDVFADNQNRWYDINLCASEAAAELALEQQLDQTGWRSYTEAQLRIVPVEQSQHSEGKPAGVFRDGVKLNTIPAAFQDGQSVEKVCLDH